MPSSHVSLIAECWRQNADAAGSQQAPCGASVWLPMKLSLTHAQAIQYYHLHFLEKADRPLMPGKDIKHMVTSLQIKLNMPDNSTREEVVTSLFHAEDPGMDAGEGS